MTNGSSVMRKLSYESPHSPRLFGDKHEAVFDAMENVALSFDRQGRLQEVEGLDGQVLSIRKEVEGPRSERAIGVAIELAGI